MAIERVVRLALVSLIPCLFSAGCTRVVMIPAGAPAQPGALVTPMASTTVQTPAGSVPSAAVSTVPGATTNTSATAPATAGSLASNVPADLSPGGIGGLRDLIARTATDQTDSATRVTRVGFGQQVSLTDQIYRGKVTIVQFCSDFCPSCQRINQFLPDTVRRNPAVSLRTIDINRPGVQGIDWQSPVYTQYQDMLTGVPYFIVYDGNGQEVARGDAARSMILNWLEENRL